MLVGCWSPQGDQAATKASWIQVAIGGPSCYQGQWGTGCHRRTKLLPRLVGYWLLQEDQAVTKTSWVLVILGRPSCITKASWILVALGGRRCYQDQLDSGCQLLLYPYWKTTTETFFGEGTMSFGNSSKSMVTQYQLRPRDAIRQPR